MNRICILQVKIDCFTIYFCCSLSYMLTMRFMPTTSIYACIYLFMKNNQFFSFSFFRKNNSMIQLIAVSISMAQYIQKVRWLSSVSNGILTDINNRIFLTQQIYSSYQRHLPLVGIIRLDTDPLNTSRHVKYQYVHTMSTV